VIRDRNRGLQEWTSSPPKPGIEEVLYTSNILRLFVEELVKRQNALVLDVGLVCDQNINFFAQHVKKVYVCDLLHHIIGEKQEEGPLSIVSKHLDYPPKSFDGILLWDLIDHLDNREASDLGNRCHAITKPKGVLVVISLGDQHDSSRLRSFVVEEDFRLHLRPQTDHELPVQSRQNQELVSLLEPLKLIKSFVYRDGLRELMFQRS
jgi:2-polyprenyl-3-methyl-5-hydroxy-6-metoxy-1,4-benzoquinol methylase